MLLSLGFFHSETNADRQMVSSDGVTGDYWLN
jgi:hypothetical protein